MTNHHFISYSPADAQDFAFTLCDQLTAGPPSFPVWLDKRELQPGEDWDEQIVDAIRTCDSLIFVMTPDSVAPNSVCKNEWSRALKYKKSIIPLKLNPTVEIPFQLENRQWLDFSGDLKPALARLRSHLNWLKSPEGELRLLNDRLHDAQRAWRRAPDPQQQARAQDDIAQLEQQIEALQKVIDNPTAAAKRVEESIERGLERERQPKTPVSAAKRTKFINPPPGVAPNYFQDRYVETKLIAQFLHEDACRLMTVCGRAGIGKTAMVCRLLKALEAGHLPDDLGALAIDGIVYLSETGSHKINFANLFADLCLLLPPATAEKLDPLYKNPQLSTTHKMEQLLEAFPAGRVLLLLDNFEDKVNRETRDLADAELNEALQALLNAAHHGVKVIITSRVAPRNLCLTQPGRQQHIELDEGLDSPYAENLLRQMDADGKLGLQEAPNDLLLEAKTRTRGFPRALEALVAILKADRETTLPELLADTQRVLPEYVVEKLVGEAFSRLDTPAQQVLQALAIYARPVTPAAVDYLLQPFLPGVNSAPVLNRLVNMQFVRKESGSYYLHPVDRDYALARIPKGQPAERQLKQKETADATGLPFTRFTLWHRGADYFKKARLPRDNWKTLDDLAPQLAEFELRLAGQDFDTAAEVLLTIDFDYLLLWGHYRLMLNLHRRLQGKIGDSDLKEESVGNLGTAYRQIGQVQLAIQCYHEALEMARQNKSRSGEAAWLGGLGSCYAGLGQTTQAIEYYEQALEIDREIGDRKGKAADLDNLGSFYAVLGQTTRAIEYYEQALEIDREIGYREGEATALNNLGLCYADLAQTTRAIEYYEKALVIYRGIGYRYGEALDLCYLGSIWLDLNNFSKAIEYQHQAIQIADEIENVQAQNEARDELAQAYLFSDNLDLAREIIEEALKYNYPINNFNVFALQGIIALRQRQVTAAKAAFEKTIHAADALLQHTEQNFDALDTKGLALCGLALCEPEPNRFAAAKDAFHRARQINNDLGIVKRLLRLFDALARADQEGMLAPLREVVEKG